MDLSKLSASNGSGEAVRALVTVIRSPGGTVLTPNSMVNWPTNITATTGPLLADGTLDPAKTIVFMGHISGSTVIIDGLAPGYTDTYGNAVGDVIVIKPTTWWADTVINSVRVSHNDDGTLKPTAVQKANTLSWSAAIGVVPTAVTNNGNRSYDWTMPSDLTGTVSPGMRIMATRTTAAPTQSTNLNGTTQYWSRVSPAGYAAWTAFTLAGWVKITSYSAANQTIVRRANTAGFALHLTTSGQVRIFYGTASAFTDLQSYQSIPLNKWVHLAGVITSTASKTGAIYIDGISVSTVSTVTGATAMTQDTVNLTIGASHTPAEFLVGSVAQVGVFSAALSQATIKSMMTQGLLGTETANVSAYSLSGATGFNDLNTTNANNLAANGSATTTNADAPFGGQGNGTISSTLDYGILQKATATTWTVQAAEGCTFPTNSGGVSAVNYSTVKSPIGFPTNKYKWCIEYKFKTQLAQTVTSNAVWYNLSNINFTIPAGEWDCQASFFGKSIVTVATSYVGAYFGISTSASAISQDDLVASTPLPSVSQQESNGLVKLEGSISNTTATTWYLITRPVNVSGVTNNYVDQQTNAGTFRFYPASLMV